MAIRSSTRWAGAAPFTCALQDVPLAYAPRGRGHGTVNGPAAWRPFFLDEHKPLTGALVRGSDAPMVLDEMAVQIPEHSEVQEAHGLAPPHDGWSVKSYETTAPFILRLGEAARSLYFMASSCKCNWTTGFVRISREELFLRKPLAQLAAEAVLIYCFSSTNIVKRSNFIMDINYLNDKPNADNCPQRIYDALMNALDS